MSQFHLELVGSNPTGAIFIYTYVAAKDGRTSVLIYLDDEDDYKTQVVRQFLIREGIDFKKSYDSYTTTRLPYIDTHMGGYEGVDPNKPVTVTEHRFKGIRVFL